MNRPSSSVAVTPATQAKHLTYTTAGTIYNPTTTQPLQPPTRRGRMPKWQPSHPPPDSLSLLPLQFLEELHLRGGRANALVPRPKSTPIVYGPLQQNLDRAVRPHIEDHPNNVVEAHGQAPAIAPHSTMQDDEDYFCLKRDESRQFDVNSKIAVGAVPAATTDEQDMEDSAKNSLDQLPVKALFSLMSYPNPSQEQARKRWEEAKGGSVVQPGSQNGRGVGVSTPGIIQPPSALSQSRPARIAADSSTESQGHHIPDGSYPILASSHTLPIYQPTPVNPVVKRRAVELSGTLSTGPGAPAPLTAGPPGQRQYRPPAFEPSMMPSSGNPARTLDKLSQSDYDSRHTARIARGAQYGPIGSHRPPTQCHVDIIEPRQAYKEVPAYEMVAALGATTKDSEDDSFTLTPDTIKSYLDLVSDDDSSLGVSNLDGATPEHRDEHLNGYTANADDWWYAGAFRMAKAAGQTDNCIEPRGFMTVEEANGIPTAEHAKPILCIALDNIARYIESGEYQRMVSIDKQRKKSWIGN